MDGSKGSKVTVTFWDTHFSQANPPRRFVKQNGGRGLANFENL
jgi:hypothetical protein